MVEQIYSNYPYTSRSFISHSRKYGTFITSNEREHYNVLLVKDNEIVLSDEYSISYMELFNHFQWSISQYPCRNVGNVIVYDNFEELKNYLKLNYIPTIDLESQMDHIYKNPNGCIFFYNLFDDKNGCVEIKKLPVYQKSFYDLMLVVEK